MSSGTGLRFRICLNFKELKVNVALRYSRCFDNICNNKYKCILVILNRSSLHNWRQRVEILFLTNVFNSCSSIQVRILLVCMYIQG